MTLIRNGYRLGEAVIAAVRGVIQMQPPGITGYHDPTGGIDDDGAGNDLLVAIPPAVRFTPDRSGRLSGIPRTDFPLAAQYAVSYTP
jgi:hypothetical protein